MSELDDLIALYSEWPDLQLLEAFQNKKDYSPIGVSGMKEVLKQRGLWDEVVNGNLESLINKENRISEIAQKAHITGLSVRALQEQLSPNENGVYVKALVLGGPKAKSTKKAELLMTQDQGCVRVQIKSKKNELGFISPFNVSYYATKTDKRVNFFKVSFWYTLYIHFTLSTGESIIIYRDLTTYKELPAGWKLIDFDSSILSADYKFQYMSNEIRLTDLKKLTDQFKV